MLDRSPALRRHASAHPLTGALRVAIQHNRRARHRYLAQPCPDPGDLRRPARHGVLHERRRGPLHPRQPHPGPPAGDEEPLRPAGVHGDPAVPRPARPRTRPRTIACCAAMPSRTTWRPTSTPTARPAGASPSSVRCMPGSKWPGWWASRATWACPTAGTRPSSACSRRSTTSRRISIRRCACRRWRTSPGFPSPSSNACSSACSSSPRSRCSRRHGSKRPCNCCRPT